MKKKILLLILLVLIFSLGCNKEDKKTEIDLKNCKTYYDGCNTCELVNEEMGSCTERYCEPQEYEQPKCLEYIK